MQTIERAFHFMVGALVLALPVACSSAAAPWEQTESQSSALSSSQINGTEVTFGYAPSSPTKLAPLARDPMTYSQQELIKEGYFPSGSHSGPRRLFKMAQNGVARVPRIPSWEGDPR